MAGEVGYLSSMQERNGCQRGIRQLPWVPRENADFG